MYLSKLKMHGFKSFAQATELDFDPGITAVVGPNGCGKSNIVDAVRWVIGEQRARILRSDKMDNVIFNGTSRRKPLGMAEVILTIENTRGVLPTEYSEVTVGRRLFRSGDSEYLLNGVQCRLKDILDLFMDTGMGPGAYSVIELKMVDEILSENAQDRRRLFEEAAGITKYKLRRSQALRKLDNTQANLTRLRDLTEEIGKQVRSLKRQADKAAQAREIETRLHALELTLAQTEWNRLAEQARTLQAETSTLHDQIEAHTTEQIREEAALEAIRTRLVEKEQTLAARQRTLNDHLDVVRSLETEKRLAQERLDAARLDQERTTREREETGVRITDLKRRLGHLRNDLDAAVPVREQAEQAAAEAKTESDRLAAVAAERRERLNALRAAEQEADEARTDHRRHLDRLTNRLDLLRQNLERTSAQRASIDETVEDYDARLRHGTTQRDEAREAVDVAREALDDVEQRRADLRQRLEAATETRRGIERRHDALSAEAQLLQSLVSSYEDFSDAVRFLAGRTDWSPEALQTVADVIGCDEAHRPALEAALGDMASCIVVRSDREAVEAISLLRNQEQGQANLIVLDRLPAAGAHTNGHFDAHSLPDVVRVRDGAFRPLAELLLHNCYLVDSLEQGRGLIEGASGPVRDLPVRFFAPSGEWVDARGLMRGGSRAGEAGPTTSRLQRREQLDAARTTLEHLQADLSQAEAAIDALKAELDALPYEARRNALSTAERALADAEKEHARLSQEGTMLAGQREELVTRHRKLEEDLDTDQREVAALQKAVEDAETRLAGARSTRALADKDFQTAEADSWSALHRFNTINVAAVEARNRCDNMQRDLERSESDLATLKDQLQSRIAHLDVLDARIATSRAQQAELDEQITALYGERSALEDGVFEAEQAVQHSRTEIGGVEGRLRTLRQAREQNMREENQRAVRLAEVQTRATDLLENIQTDFGVSLRDNPVQIEDTFDEDVARTEVKDLRVRLRGLGSINELALETYEQERERFEFLTAQQEDLEQAEKTLLDTISEINTTAAEQFTTTFESIRTNFQRLFATLFTEGDTADLTLADPNDPLESPIEITAKPRGKRPSAITQLSGGEKTLTATALLFAIYLVKPSPFCILDEVDAPLDEANIERFMNLIREFSRDTQFILVTHNRRTMELADCLYGITMEEEGISKLVGVRFDEALEMAGTD